jgi:hypothetical protein
MNNPPAFPLPLKWANENYHGMTLRDYFAAKVLPQCFEVSTTTDIAAKEAYRMADAMLKAREA